MTMGTDQQQRCECLVIVAAQDPIFKGNKVPNPELGYPGGIFDPFGFSKGSFKVLVLDLSVGELLLVHIPQSCSMPHSSLVPSFARPCTTEEAPVSCALQPHAVKCCHGYHRLAC